MAEGVVVPLLDGAQLWTATTTSPGAPGLVLLHGGAGLWDYLEPVAHVVGDRATTHRYDQRGCGRSTPDDQQTLARAVADLEELRLAFGHQRWVVFGHSFGAALALTYAATHPTSVTAVVWCAGTGPDWAERRAEHRARARARLSAAQALELDRLDALGPEGRTWTEEVAWRTLCWLPDHPDPAAAADEVAAFAATPLRINHAANAAFSAELDGRSAAEQLGECARVQVPVLVISGEGDPRPGDGAARVAAALPRGEHVILEGAGHLPWSEQPERFAALLRAFLARVTAG